MRLVIDDPAGEGRSLTAEQLPVSLTLGPQGLQAQPRTEKVLLNGQPLLERRLLSHGDVLRVGELYIFVARDADGFRLRLDRQAGVAEPPMLEPDESVEGSETDAQSSRRAAFRPLGQEYPVRKASSPVRRLFLIVVLGVLAAFLWFPRSHSPPAVPPSHPKAVTEAPAVTPAAEVPASANQENPGSNTTPADSRPASDLAAAAPKLPLGQVTVRGKPADAQVFVEDKPKGPAGKTLALPATLLRLEVRRDGYESFTTSVTPQPGFPRVVEYQLRTPEQVQAERFPAVIMTKGGIELRLMPTGRFDMGSARRDAGSRANESSRAVILQRRFYLGTKEVTNADYVRFKPEHLSGVVKDRSLDQDTHPVVNISWREAAEFCNWLSAQEGLAPAYGQQGENLVLTSPVTTGYRLPTEAEWEWAARYDSSKGSGQATRRYPWGQELPLPPASGNYADRASLVLLENAFEGYDDGFPATAPVGHFPPNPLGLFDIGGNVSEWANDLYTVYRELDSSSATDPTGPASGASHVIRGSNWRTASITELRLPWREAAPDKSQTIGFRIARYAE